MMFDVEDIIVLNSDNLVTHVDETSVRFADGSYIDVTEYGFDRFAKVEIELWKFKELLDMCQGAINYRKTEENIDNLLDEAKEEAAEDKEEELEAKIEDLETTIENLKYDIKELKDEVNNLEEDNANLKYEIQELESKGE